MRYILTDELKSIIRSNKGILFNSKLRNNIKNFLYKNQTISDKHIKELSSILHLDLKKIMLEISNRNYEKNLGKYSKSAVFKFSGISRNFAEFVGIMLGDGNIYRNSIRIIISKDEKEFGEYINKLFYRIFGMNINYYVYRNTLVFSKHNKGLVELLMKYGLKKGNKIENQVSIPKWILTKKEYMICCLRGLIDTDACFYECKRDKKFYIQFTNHSLNLLEDIIKMSRNVGFNFVKAGKYRICLYKNKQIKIYINNVGSSNPKHSSKLGAVV